MSITPLSRSILPLISGLWLAALQPSEGETPTVELDTSAAPEQATWGESAKELVEAWYPRISNLLASPDFELPGEVRLTLKPMGNAPGATAGNHIFISSGWIEAHPDDTGLVIHELVHVVQSYPSPDPGWITEGIADYIRRVVYEGRPLDWFPVPERPNAYQSGYGPAAGFLFWLESDRAPGIVRRLNRTMREGGDTDNVFETMTGELPPALWKAYVAVRKN